MNICQNWGHWNPPDGNKIKWASCQYCTLNSLTDLDWNRNWTKNINLLDWDKLSCCSSQAQSSSAWRSSPIFHGDGWPAGSSQVGFIPGIKTDMLGHFWDLNLIDKLLHLNFLLVRFGNVRTFLISIRIETHFGQSPSPLPAVWSETSHRKISSEKSQSECQQNIMRSRSGQVRSDCRPDWNVDMKI